MILKMSIQLFGPFLKSCCFFHVDLKELFIYVRYESFIDHIICKYLLPFNRLSFHFVKGFLCCAKDFKFNQVPSVYFCFYFLYVRRQIQKNIATIYVKECSACVFLQEYYSIGLTYRSLIHFEFIFVYGVKEYPNFIFLNVAVQFSQHHLLNRLVFSPLYTLAFFVVD